MTKFDKARKSGESGNSFGLIVGVFSLLMVFISAVFFLAERLSINEKMIWCAVLILSIVCFAFLSMQKGFLLIVIELVVLGIYLVLTNWNVTHTSQAEVWSIVLQMVSASVIVSIWLTISLYKNLLLQIKELTQQVNSLKKTDEESGLLTFDEFMDQLKIVFTGMERRKEEGYFILLFLNSERARWAKDAITWSVSKSMLSSVRDQYDLVAKLNEDFLIAALQNTDEEGCEIVKQRMATRINEFMKEKVQNYFFQVKEEPIASNWSDVERQLMPYRDEESL